MSVVALHSRPSGGSTPSGCSSSDGVTLNSCYIFSKLANDVLLVSLSHSLALSFSSFIFYSSIFFIIFLFLYLHHHLFLQISSSISSSFSFSSESSRLFHIIYFLSLALSLSPPPPGPFFCVGEKYFMKNFTRGHASPCLSVSIEHTLHHATQIASKPTDR